MNIKIVAIVAGCLLTIGGIWFFCATIGPKEEKAAIEQQVPATAEDDAARKKRIRELTDFSKLNTKPVEDPGF